jgi:LPS-assembly protein
MVSGPAQAGTPVSFLGPSICVPGRIPTPATLLPYLGQDHSGFPIELEADQISAPEPDVLTLVGNASVVQGAQAIYANQMKWEDRVVKADGNVVMHSIQGDRITADLLQLDLETRIGRADNVHFQKAILDGSTAGCLRGDCLTQSTYYPAVPGYSAEPKVHVRMRGHAERTFFEGHDRERHENVEWSHCLEGDDSVVLTARQIILDHSVGEATGRDLSVRFFDVPIFYFPTVTFPISDDRKTGFLFPTLGFSGSHGMRLGIPYYWNFASNHDATITTDYMSARGMRLHGEYRYMDGTQPGEFNGRIGAEIIPNDRQFGEKRYGWSLFHNQQFNEQWQGQLDLGYVSDLDYLDDFGDTLGVENAAYVPQMAILEYQRGSWLLADDKFNFGLLLSDYQIIDPLVSEEEKPYSRVPQVTLGWHPDIVGSLLESDINAVWTRFDHPIAARSVGNRLSVRPGVKINAEQDYGFLRPQLDLDLISYRLDRRSAEEARYSGLMIPVFSVDSGLVLERDINWRDQPWIQTLEPRLFYAFVPFIDQEDQPIFDDEEFDLNTLSKYFVPNRFYRSDRVGDTNRISIGFKSLMIEPASRKQRLRTELGQIFYLSDRKVRAIRGAEPLTNRYSDLLGEMDVNWTDEFSTSMGVAWNWNNTRVSSTHARLRYRDYRGQYGLSYGFNREESEEELKGEFIWSVSPHWLASLNQGYSLENSNWNATEFSLGYDGCCWAIQFHAEGAPVAFMFTLQLKGFGGISSSSFREITTGLSLD